MIIRKIEHGTYLDYFFTWNAPDLINQNPKGIIAAGAWIGKLPTVGFLQRAKAELISINILSKLSNITTAFLVPFHLQ